jgi:hypothetical protein
MPRLKDLTGFRIGRLVVLKRLPNRNYQRYWLCKCDCGNEKEIYGGNLTRANQPTRSCGCYNKEQSTINNRKDLTGKRFGRLVAIRRVEAENGRKIKWECICDCGNKTTAITYYLTSGKKISCRKCTGGKNHPSWKGGRQETKAGYILVYCKGHPFADKNNRIFEHRLAMEEKLGRHLLPNENVHHKNGIRSDNRIENLELWTTAQPAGKRVEDLIAFSLEILSQYAPDKLNNSFVVN